MAELPIESLDDPRLAPYRNVKDRELSRRGGRFIAEGEHVVRRMLAAGIRAESLLLSTRKARAILPLVPADVPVWVAGDSVIQQIIGFEFHSGVMAVGIRPPSPSLEEALPQEKPRLTAVLCPQVTNIENMGSLIRICAALGADAMVLGERCCDPYYRQSVRVSMGAVFKLPMVQSQDIVRDMDRLRREWRMELAATVLDGSVEPLHHARRGARLGIVLGNEAEGLMPEHVAACDRKVTIPMKRGTDSLNLAVAAGLFLYHFCRED